MMLHYSQLLSQLSAFNSLVNIKLFVHGDFLLFLKKHVSSV
ncbi:unknown [Prevotella sp. CAG:1124]|nr:unknown [Prevotella sp. CAG:1124]